MLSVSDYHHLTLLYEKFFESNSHVKELILADDWDSVEVAVKEKEDLIRQIIFFEKPRVQLIKNNYELMEKRKKLVELEKKNIELVKLKKKDMLAEISNVSKAKKVLNAYEPQVNKVSSTFDIKDEE